MPGKPASNDQRLLAARLLAGGTAHTATASSIGISVRTLQRWLADPAFTKMIEKALGAKEHSQHRTAVRSARTQGVPDPPHPRDVRAASAALRRSPEEAIRADDTLSPKERDARLQLLQSEERRRRTINPSDSDIQEWLLSDAPIECQEDRLDFNDGRRGVISARARKRYASKDYPRSPARSPLIMGIDTNASLMYQEMQASQHWASRDVFAGQYASDPDPGGWFGSTTHGLREVFIPQDDAA
jgi:hypothetical protein